MIILIDHFLYSLIELLPLWFYFVELSLHIYHMLLSPLMINYRLLTFFSSSVCMWFLWVLKTESFSIVIVPSRIRNWRKRSMRIYLFNFYLMEFIIWNESVRYFLITVSIIYFIISLACLFLWLSCQVTAYVLIQFNQWSCFIFRISFWNRLIYLFRNFFIKVRLLLTKSILAKHMITIISLTNNSTLSYIYKSRSHFLNLFWAFKDLNPFSITFENIIDSYFDSFNILMLSKIDLFVYLILYKHL